MLFHRYLLPLLTGTIVCTAALSPAAIPVQAQPTLQNIQRSQQFLRRGNKLYRRGKFDAAAAAFAKSKAMRPTFEAAYFLGVTQLNRLKNFQAIPAFAEAIQLEPKHASVPAAYSHIGKAYLNLKQYPAAIAAYQQAVARQPKNSRFHESLGIAYHLHGQYRKAVQAYETALRLNPNNRDIRTILNKARASRKP